VVDQLRTLDEASEIHGLLDTVYVIDQARAGPRTIRASPTRPRSSATGCR
jgi:hypothetical protein